MNNIHPLGERVLVKHRPQEKVTSGGIVLPDLKPGSTPTEYGTIIEVGPDVVGLEEGMDVVFHRHAGAEIEDKESSGKFQLLLAESIMATVDIERCPHGLRLTEQCDECDADIRAITHGEQAS